MTPLKNEVVGQDPSLSLNINGARHVHDDSLRLARNCPECVAYDLMRDIIFDDPKKPLPQSREFRAYILDLYAECLDAVKGRRFASSLATTPISPPRELGVDAPAMEAAVATATPPASVAEPPDGMQFEHLRKRRLPA
jgi:hypothetical protein